MHMVCLDVANGYSEFFVDRVRKVRERHAQATIFAGNVVTGEMVEELILTGADVRFLFPVSMCLPPRRVECVETFCFIFTCMYLYYVCALDGDINIWICCNCIVFFFSFCRRSRLALVLVRCVRPAVKRGWGTHNCRPSLNAPMPRMDWEVT